MATGIKTKIIISLGTGGVGKTTVSGALGCKLYSEGNKVLLLTLDPSKSLMRLFSVKKQRTVIKENKEALLEVCCADAESSFNQFLKSVSSQSSEKLSKNKLFRLLHGKLSGAQDFTSLNQLYVEYKKNNYDFIILDTPPLQNSKDFLTSPQRIEALFNKSFVRWMSSEKEAGVIKKILSGGLAAATSALSKITGKEFFEELKGFFEATSSLGDKITERAADVSRLIVSKSLSCVLVSGADFMHLEQIDKIVKELGEMNLRLSSLYLNRVGAPPSLVESDKKTDLEKSFDGLFKNRGDRLKSFKKRLSKDLKVVTISERDKPVTTLDELIEMATSLTP